MSKKSSHSDVGMLCDGWPTLRATDRVLFSKEAETAFWSGSADQAEACEREGVTVPVNDNEDAREEPRRRTLGAHPRPTKE